MQVGKVETYEQIHIKATWTIQIIDLVMCDIGEYFESASFSTFHNESEIKWHLRIYPKGDSARTKEYIFVNLLGKCDLNITANINFHLGPMCHLNNNETGVRQLFERKRVFNEDNMLKKGATLKIESTISITNMKAETEENVKGLNNFRSREHVSFENLLDCEQFSDVTFDLGGKSVYGHKNLLVSRSPVFAAMFQNGMIESTSKVVTIGNIEHEIFREMLRYLYAAKVNNIDKFAVQLLRAADMYVINGLKYLCEEFLSENLNLENVLEYFTMAEQYNAAKLKVETVNFMKANAKDIIYKPDFKSSNAMFEMLQMQLGLGAHEAKNVPQGQTILVMQPRKKYKTAVINNKVVIIPYIEGNLKSKH